MKKRKKTATILASSGRNPSANHGAVNPPVYRASTILFETLAKVHESHRHDPTKARYGRHGTPTTFALEEAICDLEGGHQSIVVGSGAAAVSAVLAAYVKTGDHVLMVDTAYGPTRRFCDRYLKRMGVATTYYDPCIGAGIADLIRPNTRTIFLESPGSQTFEVQDVPAIAAAARKAGVITAMDNTWATPLYFKPLAHGVDVSIISATKYIGGHSDLMMGVITTNESAYRAARHAVEDFGCCSSPDDCYLALRGLRTLGVRLPQHQANGLALARWLKNRPEVVRLLHPALPDDPGHAIWKRDFTGASGLFGFELKPVGETALAAMLDGMELFGMGYSWGGFESLILPSDLRGLRTAVPWTSPGPLIRVHAGLEDVDDLTDDLAQGFERLKAAS
jgi:cystathionine beta-lyase